MIFDIRPLLTVQFWFQTNPPTFLPFFEKAFFIVYLIALVVSVVTGGFERKKKGGMVKKFFEKTRRITTTFGITGLLLSFFSYERTPVLSMRLFTLLLWVGVVTWGIVVLFWRFRIAPHIEKTIVEKKEFEKYLPK